MRESFGSIRERRLRYILVCFISDNSSTYNPITVPPEKAWKSLFVRFSFRPAHNKLNKAQRDITQYSSRWKRYSSQVRCLLNFLQVHQLASLQKFIWTSITLSLSHFSYIRQDRDCWGDFLIKKITLGVARPCEKARL